jgi:hypothetical protein
MVSRRSIHRRCVLAFTLVIGVFLCICTPLWKANLVSKRSVTKSNRPYDFWIPSSSSHQEIPRIIAPYSEYPIYTESDINSTSSTLSDGISIFNNRLKDDDWNKYRDFWHQKRPPLDQLVRNDKDGIVGDTRPLLDFAILGHAKCATSFLMKWLFVHPEAKIWKFEVCDLYQSKPALLARKLYQDLPEGSEYQRGFKCPGHLSLRSLLYFRRFFGKTRLVIGVRHPVRWFER